jgi:excisionase family DNA binding protein
MVVDIDYGPTHENLVYDRNEMVDVHDIVTQPPPPERLEEEREIKIPLFRQGGATIVREIGSYGVYYLILQPGYLLTKLVVVPNETFMDITLTGEQLVYAFYNPTRQLCISISATMQEDLEGIADKLAEEINNPVWRQYIIQLSLERNQFKRDRSIEEFPDIMEAKQVGKLLGVEEKTVRNWTSDGRIPHKKMGKLVRYKKSDILEAFEAGQIGNATKWKARVQKVSKK